MMPMEAKQDTAVPLSSPLPHLGLVLASPSPALAPYVHSYWFVHRSWARPYLLEEQLYPGGGLGLVFNAGDPLLVNGTAVTSPAFLDATNSLRARLSFPQHTALVGVRFHPGGAYPFLPLPLKEVQNAPVALDHILPAMSPSVGERLAAAPTLPQKIAFLEEMLRQWRQPHRELSADARTSLNIIRQTQGQVNVKSLADAVCISQRQLERLFQTQVGMSAKTYARLVRVEQARAMLKQVLSTAVHLSQDLGYYDQSHFIHDFQAIMGQTPQQYRQRRAQRPQNGSSAGSSQEDSG